MKRLRELLRNVRSNLPLWYGGLSEVWQPGYSMDYRKYRLYEALSALIPLKDKQESPDKVEALREALEFYADGMNYIPDIYALGHGACNYGPSEIEIDRGAKARAALGSSEPKKN